MMGRLNHDQGQLFYSFCIEEVVSPGPRDRLFSTCRGSMPSSLPYIRPAGELLRTTGTISTDHAMRYIAPVPVCRACPLKPKCCPNMPAPRGPPQSHPRGPPTNPRGLTPMQFAIPSNINGLATV
jgi:hypothetical protein